MKAKEFYNVAIYLRLSRDDEDIDGNKAESNSISSQRDMIRSEFCAIPLSILRNE